MRLEIERPLYLHQELLCRLISRGFRLLFTSFEESRHLVGPDVKARGQSLVYSLLDSLKLLAFFEQFSIELLLERVVRAELTDEEVKRVLRKLLAAVNPVEGRAQKSD